MLHGERARISTPPLNEGEEAYAVVYEDVKTTTGWGGYYPVTSTTPDTPVESAKTADPIGLYIGVSILGAFGTAVLGRKRED